MTIQDQTAKITLEGDASTTAWAGDPLYIYDADDVDVVLVDANGDETALTRGTGSTKYAITAQSTFPGLFTITYPQDEVTPIASGVSLVVKTNLTLEQQTRLTTQGGYSPVNVERQFDKVVQMLIAHQEELNRCLKFPVSEDSANSPEVPNEQDRASAVLGFDADGVPTVFAESDQFPAPGAGTAFDLVRVNAGSTAYEQVSLTELLTGIALVFNEGGGDFDARFEGDTDANLLFLDAGNDRVGIGTSTPDGKLHVHSATAGSVSAASNADELVVEGPGNVGMTFLSPAANLAAIYFGDPDDNDVGQIVYSHSTPEMRFVVETAERIVMGTAATIFNDPGADIDFCVEGDTDANLLFINAGDDRVGIGTNSPSVKLDVSGTITGTAMESTPIGAGTPAAGTFTALTSTGIDDNATETALTISSDEEITMGLQPAFSVIPTSAQNNIAPGSDVTIVWGTEIYDIGANFATNTFTAPITGKYLMCVELQFNNWDSVASSTTLKINTSNRTYTLICDPADFAGDVSEWHFSYSAVVDMDASDTATVSIQFAAGGTQADITQNSRWTGILLA